MKVDNLESRGEQSGIIAKIQIDQDAGGIVHIEIWRMQSFN